jgi:hypothetical protein
MTFAVMLGIKFFFTEPPDQLAVNDTTQLVAEPALPELRTPEEDTLVVPEDTAPEDAPIEEPEAGGDRPVRPTMSTATTMQTTSTSMLSAEDRARLERFGAGGGASPTAIAVGTGGMASSSASSGPGLNADQLNRVVTNHRPSLRRCYETAIRGMGNPPTVRVNVNITVGTSGRVSRVNATATNQLPGLTTCVQSAVRTWVFPSSGNSTVTAFPLVFTGAG